MAQLRAREVLRHCPVVLRELPHEGTHLEVGRLPHGKGEVVRLVENVQAPRREHRAEAPHGLLECGGGRPTAVHLTVVAAAHQQCRCQHRRGLHHGLRGVCAGKGPAGVGRSVPHVGAHAVRAAANVVAQRLRDRHRRRRQALRQEQASAG